MAIHRERRIFSRRPLYPLSQFGIKYRNYKSHLTKKPFFFRINSRTSYKLQKISKLERIIEFFKKKHETIRANTKT